MRPRRFPDDEANCCVPAGRRPARRPGARRRDDVPGDGPRRPRDQGGGYHQKGAGRRHGRARQDGVEEPGHGEEARDPPSWAQASCHRHEAEGCARPALQVVRRRGNPVEAGRASTGRSKRCKTIRHVSRLVQPALLAAALLLASPGPVVACRDFAQAPGSRWRLASRQGVAWLVTPCGDPFFSIGINALNGGAPAREAAGRIAYHWGSYYPQLDGWLATTRARAARWGLNTAGAPALPPDGLALPIIPDLELGRTARFHWVDPFHPATEERMRAAARRLVAPYKGSPFRIGYFSDNEVGWWNGAIFASIWGKRQPINPSSGSWRSCARPTATTGTASRVTSCPHRASPPSRISWRTRARRHTSGAAATASRLSAAGPPWWPSATTISSTTRSARPIPTRSSSATGSPSTTTRRPCAPWHPGSTPSPPTTTSTVPTAGSRATTSTACAS